MTRRRRGRRDQHKRRIGGASRAKARANVGGPVRAYVSVALPLDGSASAVKVLNFVDVQELLQTRLEVIIQLGLRDDLVPDQILIFHLLRPSRSPPGLVDRAAARSVVVGEVVVARCLEEHFTVSGNT